MTTEIMSYEETISQVAKETGLPCELVKKTYKSFWRAVKEHIEALPLKDNLSDEEFLKLQPNVNIPSIGKLYVDLKRYKRVKKSFEVRNYKIKETKKQDNNAIKD